MSKLKESFILNVAFPLADKLMGTCAMKWYRQICEMKSWSKSEITNWQNEHLQAFVKHAYDHTIYYKRLFDELGLKPEDIQCAEDLKRLPVINKDIVQVHFDEIIPDDIEKIKHRKGRTGGTTGEPMYYYCDENTWGYVTANKIFSWKSTGYRYGDAFVALGSASLFPEKRNRVREIYDKLRNEHGLNGMNLSDEICKKHVDYIRKKRIKYIYGYAASVYLLTKYVAANKIDLTFVKAVFTTSEKLTDEYRQLIEDTYKCIVMDCYGAKDAGITAFEIERGRLNIGYNVIAETINNIDIDSGTLLTTNFLNYAFPLIRYEFGDEALLSEDESFNGQRITEIIGRSSDVMRLGNGRNVTGPGFTILMKPYDIVAYEVRQVGDLIVELRIQPDSKKYSKEQESAIASKFHEYIGADCVLNIIYVDHFEPLKNGKRRYFMN